MESYIIGITGGSGSGKTRFIQELIKGFKGHEICLISQDNYYRNKDEQPRDDNEKLNFDLPESIDIPRFLNDLKQLTKGEDVYIREYTFNKPGLNASMIHMQPAPVIILEGIFIFFVKEILDLINLKIFIDAREHIMIKRRIIRDRKERGYNMDDVFYMYENHVMPAFDTYIKPYRESCDIVINNNSGFDESLKVVRGYIKSLL